MKRRLQIITIMLIMFSTNVFAQQTGRFDDQVTFMGQQRTLSFYVPSDYNSAESYKLMVSLHGLGDTGMNYANALFQYWSELDSKMIFVAPDGGDDPNSDFYAPAGDEEIVQSAIDFATQNYNIDPNEIILQGFSLGGRSAFKYGLDNPNKFKGLLLNTPAFQGIKDVMDIVPYSLGYNYENAKELAIVICHGTEDIAYLNVDEIMYKKLVGYNSPVVHALVEGLTHSIPPNNITAAFLEYINDPYIEEDNALIVDFSNPFLTLEETYSPKVLVRNMGENNVTDITFVVETAAGQEEYSWQGNLAPYEHAIIPMGTMPMVHGSNEYNVTIKSVNGREDGIFQDQTYQDSTLYQEYPIALPVEQGFEYDKAHDEFWDITESGHWLSWMLDDEVKKDGTLSLFMLNTPFIFDNSGISEKLKTPYIDLSNAAVPVLEFDLAFSYLHFEPPMVSQEIDFSDTLEVKITTDFGNTFHSIFRKAWKDLITAAQPLTNSQSIPECIFSPTDDEWNRIVLDLKDYSGVDYAQFEFDIISGLGGSTNIDNIAIKDGATDVDFDETGIAIYPIPARAEVNITSNNHIQSANLYNILGVKVPVTIQQGTNLKLNLVGLPSGTYMLEMKSEGNTVKKMIIKE